MISWKSVFIGLLIKAYNDRQKKKVSTNAVINLYCQRFVVVPG